MNKHLTSSLASVLFVAMCVLQTQVLAFGPAVDNYSWIVTIETDEQKQYFKYRSAELSDVTRARVSYREGKAAERDSTPYEDIWYSRGKPLGLNRLHSMELRPGDEIGIRIKHKGTNVSDNEAHAAANAALRILMDAYLNGNQVSAVLAPAGSFNYISQALQRQGMHVLMRESPDHAVQGAIVVQLVSEPEGTQETLVYSR